MRAGRLIVVGIVVAALGMIALSVMLRRSIARATVLLVTIDTLRADRLGSYGRTPSITPELDALAARGVVFEKAWSVAPLTAPAHASILTGLLPPKHGLRVNHPPAPIPAVTDRRFFTLAEMLKEQKFATGAFVSASELRGDDTGLAAGFDVYDEVPRAAPGALHGAERRGEETVAKALEWTRTQDSAVFVWVHLFDPHAPYDAPVGWGAGPQHVADAQGYDGEVAYADHCVGVLLKGLADLGRGDAVVAVVADHGEALGEHGEPSHGYLLHEATLHVPMIVAAPGLAPGRRMAPVSSVDLFPTLLGLAGQSVPPQVNGAPLFDKMSPADASRPLYAESLYGWHGCRWAQQFALRRGDEKLITSGPRTMAFDLAADPAEEHPTAPDAKQREAIAQLMLVAREPALGAMTEGATPSPGPSYVGSSAPAASPVLSDAENAKLASPYDRMDVLVKFDKACAEVAAGRGEVALTAFDQILRDDPGNLQTAFWRARALEGLHEDATAAAAYRDAFRLGFQPSACVWKSVQCSLRAVDQGDPKESDLADAFLIEARGKGARLDDARTLLFEASLRIQRGEFDKAADALRRAANAPGADSVRDGIEQAKALLEKLRK
jgi:arylsulfatase A-like enzyme